MPETPTIGRPFQLDTAWTGNRAGRPRVGEALSEYIRTLGGPHGRLCADKLHDLAVGEHRDAKVRLRPREVLLDRGWGKPIEHLNLSGSLATLDPSRLLRPSDEELATASAIAAKLMAYEPPIM
jgi:hypothetical protein